MNHTLIKICGITNAEDALFAVHEGAEMIGMIFYKNSKRCVSVEKANEISAAAKSAGAIPVAVFVDHEIEQIHSICRQIGVDTIQLHGLKVKNHLKILSQQYKCLFVVSVSTDGFYEDEWEFAKNSAEFLLFDHAQGGTGRFFKWDCFQPPKSSKWILAGGITPDNVQEAMQLKPAGIDICSGVEKPGSIVKDHRLIRHLIEKVRKKDGSKS